MRISPAHEGGGFPQQGPLRFSSRRMLMSQPRACICGGSLQILLFLVQNPPTFVAIGSASYSVRLTLKRPTRLSDNEFPLALSSLHETTLLESTSGGVSICFPKCHSRTLFGTLYCPHFSPPTPVILQHLLKALLQCYFGSRPFVHFACPYTPANIDLQSNSILQPRLCLLTMT
ncbi:hypothetical protein BOTBODRAFT_372120 [Botryobasidium botryosum FD-172 SS1]|uniref:Uncharacterized protein n=1 Tax=Botryobasidium botryosum (strain FD-172 SS1) TaxID=930990 RepID=A0A067MN31_BOTB1|nr:hypothetical protein BOTBODRAFT_372120 [Botryobasidium botryosum FD-172 SS1]